MNECLITKLKSSVADDSLKYLGGIVFDINIPKDYVYGTYSFFRCDPVDEKNPVSLEIIGNGYFRKKDNESSLGKSLTITTPTEISLSSGEYKVLVKNKYSIGLFGIYERLGVWSSDIRDFYWTTKTSFVSLQYINVQGTFEDLLVNWYRNGKRGESTVIRGLLTFNGKVNEGAYHTVIFAENIITVKAGDKVVGEYLNGVWTYNN